MVLLRSLEFLSILPFTSRFVHMLGIMFRQDLVQWSAIFVAFWVCFSAGFYTLLEGEDTVFYSPLKALDSTFLFAMGAFEVPFIEIDEDDEWTWDQSVKEGIAHILLVLLILAMTVVYLNVLIAMMSKSYEEIDDSAEVGSLQSIAEALAHWELVMSDQWKSRLRNALLEKRVTKEPISLTLDLWNTVVNNAEFVDDDSSDYVLRIVAPNLSGEGSRSAAGDPIVEELTQRIETILHLRLSDAQELQQQQFDKEMTGRTASHLVNHVSSQSPSSPPPPQEQAGQSRPTGPTGTGNDADPFHVPPKTHHL